MSESRTELLAWLNDLLQTNYTKVEQCGTGVAHCQIIDSIFRDVQMSKVKFDAKHQYEYVQNFKVLQSAFAAHKISKVVPVERLIQCKFQDNLEFLQWMKKYWDTYYPGGTYDAASTRKSKTSAGAGEAQAAAGEKRGAKSIGSVNKAPSSRADRGSKGLNPTSSIGMSSALDAHAGNGSAAWTPASDLVDTSVVDDLRKQMGELQEVVQGLEKERDFYFGKLRDIEILIEQGGENGPVTDTSAVFQEIQNILYSTEEGFDVPADSGNDPMQVGY